MTYKQINIIMLGKYLIFKMILQNAIPSMEHFKNNLKERILTEREIAISKTSLINII